MSIFFITATHFADFRTHFHSPNFPFPFSLSLAFRIEGYVTVAGFGRWERGGGQRTLTPHFLCPRRQSRKLLPSEHLQARHYWCQVKTKDVKSAKSFTVTMMKSTQLLSHHVWLLPRPVKLSNGLSSRTLDPSLSHSDQKSRSVHKARSRCQDLELQQG